MLNLSSTYTVANQAGTQTTSFSTGAPTRRYWITIAVLAGSTTLFIAGLLTRNNPLPFGADGFWLIARRRLNAVITAIVVACCHAVAIVTFQSIVNDRIITPSIMGFEVLYVVISAVVVYFFGAIGPTAANSAGMFVLQLVLMVRLPLMLCVWLLIGQDVDMHNMLLVGIVIGGGLALLSTFVQRMLTPSDFDLLTARLFRSVSNAGPEFFPVAIPPMIVTIAVIALYSRAFNVMSPRREVTTNLGVNYQVRPIAVLVTVAVLMVVPTAMVGPMTFLDFLVVTIAYQAVDTYDHRFVLPMAALTDYVILASTCFILNYVFYAQGMVSIIAELTGGPTFLYVILKKGQL